ncbi:MAG TPA: thiamine phosphate synthase [Solirubrobacteraceae bacterium]|nr:thiamine phosphate synthase [Solirubrobacteraceae bacterium]
MSDRRERLRSARLYLVCDEQSDEFLSAVLGAGVDMIQLRMKDAPDAAIVAVGQRFARAASEHGALFILNDRPDLVEAAGADGVHVGQDDVTVADARGAMGSDRLVGLSTHSPEQIDAAARMPVDYIGVGPVHATPTKPGRPAVGLALVRYAAEHATVPFVAIGGITPANAGAAREAGAERIAVVRALTEAADPAQAARRLWRALGAPAPGVGGEVRVGAAE